MTTPSLHDRISGMIWGQFAGDAATLGTHWIYDLEEMRRLYPGGVHGFEAPLEGHYHAGKTPGDQTHYGDAALLLLETVAAKGRLDIADFATRFTEFFGNKGCRSYRDHATKETLKNLAANPENYRSGAKRDDQPATVSRLPAVVAVHRDDRAVIETLTRFSQNDDLSVAYALAHAQILSALLAGKDFAAALDSVAESEPAAKIAAARAARGQSVTEATAAFGQSCPLPKSFPSAVHAALSSPDDFRAAIVEIARAGGDSAGRTGMVGAWLGATQGIAAVPEDWRQRLSARDTIQRCIAEIGKYE